MKRVVISLVVLSFIVAPAAVSPDVITLKNGRVLKGKVVKEMNELVKVRLPKRGKIVTTFLNRGNIESINKTPEEATRTVFKQAGVRNPGRDYKPVYYGGQVVAAAGGQAVARTPRGVAKAPRPGTAKNRGVEARRERFKSASDRFGKKPAATSPAAASPAAPATTSTATTTSSSGQGLQTSIFDR